MATPSTSACARRLRYNRPPFQEWPSKHSYDLMTRTSAGELPDLFHLSYRQDIAEFSPFSCPIFLGHPEASGFCFQSERLLYRREPNGVRAEPGKQKTRSCRTQELARSSGREN